MSEYKLTIIMPSFNKAQYIRETLDSVFMQKTDYPYQIIVADDHSTDGTVEIVEEYQQKHDNIILLKSGTNNRLYRNVIRAYDITKTDYFCVLDPDDYWVDEYKIQKALDFLEAHKDFTIYVTGTYLLEADGQQRKFNFPKAQDTDFSDYLNGRAFLGCTLGTTFRNVVFKNGLPEKMKVENLPDESFERTCRGDSFRGFLHIQQGKAHVVPDYDAVYRVTQEGVWQGMSKFNQHMLNTQVFINLYKYKFNQHMLNTQVFINLYKYSDEKHPELLFMAHKIFSETKADFFQEIKDFNAFKQYQTTTLYFEEKKAVWEEVLHKRMKLKYRLIYPVFKKIEAKLKRKGFI